MHAPTVGSSYAYNDIIIPAGGSYTSPEITTITGIYMPGVNFTDGSWYLMNSDNGVYVHAFYLYTRIWNTRKNESSGSNHMYVATPLQNTKLLRGYTYYLKLVEGTDALSENYTFAYDLEQSDDGLEITNLYNMDQSLSIKLKKLWSGLPENLDPSEYPTTTFKLVRYLQDRDGSKIERSKEDVLFTQERLTDEDVPEGLHTYHLRENLSRDPQSYIEKVAADDFAATIITRDMLDFNGQKSIALIPSEHIEFSGKEIDLLSFLNNDLSNLHEISSSNETGLTAN